MDRWFGLITQQAIRRGSFPNIKPLISKISSFVEHYDGKTSPFAGVATAASILAKIPRLCKPVLGIEHWITDVEKSGTQCVRKMDTNA